MSASHKLIVTAQLTTAVSVVFGGEALVAGEWQVQPGANAPAGMTTDIFIAQCHEGSLEGPNGSVWYWASDGTKFTFSFDDPYNSRTNLCHSAIDRYGPWAVPTPTYPEHGWEWTVVYEITALPNFYDAPLFPEDIINAAKCSAYSDERLKGFIGDRKCVRLADVLAHADIPADGKLWCATHPLFLTCSSKAVLARDLARYAAGELSDKGGISSTLLDNALQANYDRATRSAGGARQSELRPLLLERVHAANQRNPRDGELLGVLCALTSDDLDLGWKNAVASFIGKPEDGEWAERAKVILGIVEARL